MNTNLENKSNKVGEARKQLQDSIVEERHKLINMTNADFEKEYENHKLDSLRVICELYSINPVQLMRILRNHLVRQLIRIWESEFEQIYNEPLYMYIDEDVDRTFARIRAIDKVDNEDETLKGMVKVFCTPKGDTDKLATEVSIRGTKIYPPKGMLIGKITPIDNSFFVEFVDNDEKPTDTDKKVIGFRFEVKQVYADRTPEYTMVEVPMDEALYRNIPKTSDFPYDNRVKFLDYAETYLKAKGLIPIDNVSLTRYEIIYDERNLTIEDENIDTFIEYLTTQHKYMRSEKSKRRCEKLIKQMKMAKIISEIMELKGDEVK